MSTQNVKVKGGSFLKTGIFKSLTALVTLSLVAVLSLSFIKSTDVLAASGDVSTQIRALENDLYKIEQERSAAQRALNAAKNGKSTQMALKRQYDNEISAIETQIFTTEELISQYEISIEETEKEITVLKEEQENQIAAFDEMVRMSFMYGSDDYLQMIFEAESFSDFLSRLDMISYLLSYNQSIIDNMEEVGVKLTETRQSLALSKENLENYKVSKEQLKTDYEEKSKASSNLISKLANDEKEAAAALKIIEDSKKKLESDIAQLAKQLDDGSSYSGGVFIWPVATSSRVSSGWEWRINPISKKREFHNGLDIPAPRGTKIFAAADGTVVKCEWYGGYGNCVIINHGGGVMTLYGHCNSLNVKNGQSVKQGDVIAFVGSTGYSTGNHCHFTVYEKGNTAVNPWNYLK